MNDVTFDQVGCARCDGDGHPGMVFKPFLRPVEVAGVELTHWALCPTTGEPILMLYVDEPDEHELVGPGE